MIDIKILRDNLEGIESSLSKRGYKLDKSSFKSKGKSSAPSKEEDSSSEAVA